MDRVNYRASDRGQVQEEQEEVLQELKDLDNPEASPSQQCQHFLVNSGHDKPFRLTGLLVT